MTEVSKNSVTTTLITENEHGQRLDNLLLKKCKGVPKSHVYSIVRSGQVRVNGRRAEVSYRLQSGDLLRMPPLRIAVGPVRSLEVLGEPGHPPRRIRGEGFGIGRAQALEAIDDVVEIDEESRTHDASQQKLTTSFPSARASHY